MATCPRCHGAHPANYRCTPTWVRRLSHQAGFALAGGALGAFVQILSDSSSVPVPAIGFVLGGLVFFGLHEAIMPK